MFLPILVPIELIEILHLPSIRKGIWAATPERTPTLLRTVQGAIILQDQSTKRACLASVWLTRLHQSIIDLGLFPLYPDGPQDRLRFSMPSAKVKRVQGTIISARPVNGRACLDWALESIFCSSLISCQHSFSAGSGDRK